MANKQSILVRARTHTITIGVEVESLPLIVCVGIGALMSFFTSRPYCFGRVPEFNKTVTPSQ